MFDDTDYDGTSDLPAIISITGTENSGNATISSVPANGWVLAGNPYSSTIDWDLVSDDNSPLVVQLMYGMMQQVHIKVGMVLVV